jgi:hypothetical protein
MVVHDRSAARRYFIDAWRKRQAGSPLEPLERAVAEVVELHPEYHNFLDDAGAAIEEEFSPERGLTNPFLHMGLHIALREQLVTDRPAGITAVYRRLLGRIGDAHEVEHRMMERLGEALWAAQRHNRLPDEAAYLESLRRI